MITDLNAQIAKADSSSTIAHLLHLATEVERLSAGVAEYDSSELISSTAEVGSVRYVDDGTLRVYDSDNWRNILTEYSSPPTFTFQGTISGYISGAGIGSSFSNVIEKFSFTSDGNGSDVGDLTVTRGGTAGQSSNTHGYNSGGANTDPTAKDEIDKFSFSVDGNATDVGNLSQARYLVTGQTSSTHGYSSGGYTKAYPGTRYDNIDKFTLSSDADATDVGNLTLAGHSPAGASSSTHGYNAGRVEPTISNIIDKFSFSADGDATDVGDLATTLHAGAGNSSTTHGYSSGGRTGPSSNSNVIQKYPFATDANATDVGDLTVTRAYVAGQSSTTHGYSSGGALVPGTLQNVIDKFTFSSDANATDVGDATIAQRARTGQQV